MKTYVTSKKSERDRNKEKKFLFMTLTEANTQLCKYYTILLRHWQLVFPYSILHAAAAVAAMSNQGKSFFRSLIKVRIKYMFLLPAILLISFASHSCEAPKLKTGNVMLSHIDFNSKFMTVLIVHILWIFIHIQYKFVQIFL